MKVVVTNSLRCCGSVSPVFVEVESSAAKLKEVSLVTEPAFKSAQVLEIAAEEVIPAEETQPESEPQVEESTTAVEAPAVEAAH